MRLAGVGKLDLDMCFDLKVDHGGEVVETTKHKRGGKRGGKAHKNDAEVIEVEVDHGGENSKQHDCAAEGMTGHKRVCRVRPGHDENDGKNDEENDEKIPVRYRNNITTPATMTSLTPLLCLH